MPSQPTATGTTPCSSPRRTEWPASARTATHRRANSDQPELGLQDCLDVSRGRTGALVRCGLFPSPLYPEVFTEGTADRLMYVDFFRFQDVLLLDTDVLGSEQTECGVLQGCGIRQGGESRILGAGDGYDVHGLGRQMSHQVGEAGQWQPVIGPAPSALAQSRRRPLHRGNGEGRSCSTVTRSWSWNRIGAQASRRCHST